MNADSHAPLIDLPPIFPGTVSGKIISFFSPLMKKILALSYLNEKYQEAKICSARLDFWEKALHVLDISYDLDEYELDNIPVDKPVVVVANHPFGALEGLIMASILRKKRSDVRILANYLLERIPDMKEVLIGVDPFEASLERIKANGIALRNLYKWLHHGGLVGVFPSGQVSHLRLVKREISDPPWQESVARIIRKTKATVVPMFFKGRNDSLFQLAGLVHPVLRTVLLPHALAGHSGTRVKVSIGSPVFPHQLTAYGSDQEIITYLRQRTYLLEMRKKTGHFQQYSKHRASLNPKVPHVYPGTLISEQRTLSPDQTLFENAEFSVHVAKSVQIPKLLHEIGWLREHTFRLAGEGTGRDIDLDIFDTHYLHVFLWDKKKSRLAGAYRMGQVDEIIRNLGPKGIYSNSLFKFKAAFWKSIQPCLELGRSFVCPEYQKSYSSLLMLWKGIGKFVLKNPHYKVLFGPVSIDNGYNDASRNLMIRFMQKMDLMHEMQHLVTPRRPLKTAGKHYFEKIDMDLMIKNIEDLSKIISEIDTHKKGIPVLLRQYLKLGGKMLGFNLDPDFSNVLDGLVLVDLRKTDLQQLGRYMGKEGALDYLTYHQVTCRAKAV
ncbi:lysophospholipid acyltransferase family protein [Desulfonatronovibrio hydrogenovorans]|uniref:lysophospholipid acyltransferase family protein n=1 Tax=Desulfonatronovibrio hydrogenovorans TaxID=53245 RepID=UPI000554EBD9|nr:lysophospholipid acyltransferase family protein [Desulfonatronovibrio hydrogenovorans]